MPSSEAKNIGNAKLAKGDIVLIRAIVTRLDEPEDYVPWLEIMGHGREIAVTRDNIVSVEPRPLAVGDRVIARNEPPYQIPKSIRAISGQEAWVSIYEDIGGGIYRLEELERVP